MKDKNEITAYLIAGNSVKKIYLKMPHRVVELKALPPGSVISDDGHGCSIFYSLFYCDSKNNVAIYKLAGIEGIVGGEE